MKHVAAVLAVLFASTAFAQDSRHLVQLEPGVDIYYYPSRVKVTEGYVTVAFRMVSRSSTVDSMALLPLSLCAEKKVAPPRSVVRRAGQDDWERMAVAFCGLTRTKTHR